MKKNLTHVGCLFGFVFCLQGQGYIVPNGVTFIGYNGLGYEIRVLQNPTNSNFTGFMLMPQSKTPPSSLYTNTFFYDSYIDESVRVFLISSNQPVSQQSIQSGSYTELMRGNSYVFNHNSPFYVGLYTGETFAQNGIYSDALFGWARLRNFQGAIQMLDSGLAYNSQGIFAGTLNIIPEPTIVVLIILGGTLWGICRRNRTHE